MLSFEGINNDNDPLGLGSSSLCQKYFSREDIVRIFTGTCVLNFIAKNSNLFQFIQDKRFLCT